MDDLTIRNAVIFTPDGRVEGDLRVEGDRIAEVGTVTGAVTKEIDAAGRWLWPGAIDGHVHFREPGMTHKEDWASGSRAAVSGGVTTVFDMPNTIPAMTTVERLEEKRGLAAAKALCNFGLFFGAGPDNIDEIRQVRGVPGLKIFMADSTGELLVDRREDLDKIFAAYEGQISVHAEDQERMDQRRRQFADRDDPAVHSVIRDPQMAAEAVALAGALAIRHGRRLHILHMSTQAELHALNVVREEIIDHNDSARITAEVCPHHLFLDTSAYEALGTKVQMNPPLRSQADRDAMWAALEHGDIDMIATDHAPHRPDEKARPYREAPSGVPGVEMMVPLMLDAAFRGLCKYEEVLDWVAHRPAQIYDVVDRGVIRPGAFADLMLIDRKMIRTVADRDQRTRCGWSPYSGRDLIGWPVWTMVNGSVVFERNDDGPGQIVTDEAVGREADFKE